MSTRIISILVAAFVLAGCGERGDIAKKQNDDLKVQLATKDRFIEEVTSSINEINGKMEKAWAFEKNIMRRSSRDEGVEPLSPVQLKEHILARISGMSALLAENKKKVAALQEKLKSADTRYAGLEAMVEKLRQTVDEREQSILLLHSHVESLETDAKQKDILIAGNTVTIDDQSRRLEDQAAKLNTVYYVSGKKSDLKDRGIIADEGGIFWGLIGSTTLLASNFDEQDFFPVDKRVDTKIEVDGTIDGVIPRREEGSYETEKASNGRSVLRIVKPEEFWKEHHLVILTD